ncbi:MOSC domain-containing protein [Phytohabitans houttuyneae]|uniref:Molybdenum cofactor biosysynthesis protein n=1 Tax=Phytohabitans houttuyneae TaxID=1076126 RepID=A0A6V8KIY3_9ACTN|nr:molybdenum cofactor biosysynthesis protein [Phytohabitans houttuyneae]
MRIVGINLYPVKSTRARAVDRARVEHWGLAGDRRWAVVAPDGEPITARQCRALFTVTAENLPGDSLRLTAPGAPDLVVPRPEPVHDVPVGFINLDHAAAGGDAADEWLTATLGRPARLVWLADPTARAVPSDVGGLPGDVYQLGDTAPIHVVTLGSLRRLDDWIAETAVERGEELPEPLEVGRFRANVVVEGAPAFAEDDWQRLRLGPVDFRVAGPCGRCVMTTIDPDSREGGKEPIRTLARHRRSGGWAWFGIQLVPQTLGEIAVGDPVEVLHP